MDTHLESHLVSLSRTFKNDLTESAFQRVSERLELTFNNEELMSKWREVIDSVQTRDAKNSYHSDNPKILTSFQRKSTSYRANRHDYLTADKNGFPVYIDGMCEATRRMIPKYSDNVCLGSYVAGVDSKSIEGAKAEHDRFKQEIFDRFSNALSWYNNSFVSRLEDYQFTGDNKYTLYAVKQDLSKMSVLLNSVNDDGITNMPHTDTMLEKMNTMRKAIGNGVENFTSSKEFKEFVEVYDDYMKVCSTHKVSNDLKIKNQSKLK